MGHASDSINSMYVDIPQAHLISAIGQLKDFTDFSHITAQNHVSFTPRSARKRTKAHREKTGQNSGKALVSKAE